VPSIKSAQQSDASPTIPIIPELEHLKRAALITLASVNCRRAYEHAIERFIAWFCSLSRGLASIALSCCDIARSLNLFNSRPLRLTSVCPQSGG
jgi:hypothetical protein